MDAIFIANQTHHFGFINFLTFRLLFIYFLFIFSFQIDGRNFKHSPLYSKWKTKQKKRWNPRPNARKAVTLMLNWNAGTVSKLYFKNGFKFHILFIRLLLSSFCTLSAVRLEIWYWKFIPHYYVICNSSVYAWSNIKSIAKKRGQQQHSIANILRKSDQLRGIRELQIKNFFFLDKLFTDWETKKKIKKYFGLTNLAQGKKEQFDWSQKGAHREYQKCIFHKAKMKNRQ